MRYLALKAATDGAFLSPSFREFQLFAAKNLKECLPVIVFTLGKTYTAVYATLHDQTQKHTTALERANQS